MPRVKKTEEGKEEVKTSAVKKNKDFVFAVGRRREAVARVRLYPSVSQGLMFGEQEVKKGELYVNKMPIEKYFGGEVSKASYIEPFKTTNSLGKFAVTIAVAGGGKGGQLEAAVHGISRALSAYDKERFRKILKKKGLLTRDARTRERRKVGTGGKARRAKQSPKR